MDLTEKYLDEAWTENQKMKEVTVELVLSVSHKMGRKNEFRKALKNLLNARGESIMSLKAIKHIDGLV